MKTPIKALRAWEPYFEPDADERDEYMARPFTQIVGADGATVFNAHDLFEFKPGDAERIVACVNACAGIPIEVLTNFRSGGLPWNFADTLDMKMENNALRETLASIAAREPTPRVYYPDQYGQGFDDAINECAGVARKALS